MPIRYFSMSLFYLLVAASSGVVSGQESSSAKGRAPGIVITYAIKGADPKGKIFVQNVGGRGVIGEEQPDRTKWNPLKNGGKLELKDLDAGKYQVTRLRHLDVCKAGSGRMVIGIFLDRHQFELKANETRTVKFVRAEGQRLKGRVLGLAAAKLDRAAVFVCSKNLKSPDDRTNLDVTVLDARLCDETGRFETEQIPPGDYIVLVEGYREPTQEQLFRSGFRRPGFVAMKKITIVDENGDKPLELKLEKRKP